MMSRLPGWSRHLQFIQSMVLALLKTITNLHVLLET